MCLTSSPANPNKGEFSQKFLTPNIILERESREARVPRLKREAWQVSSQVVYNVHAVVKQLTHCVEMAYLPQLCKKLFRFL